jgi:alpha-galactosidase
MRKRDSMRSERIFEPALCRPFGTSLAVAFYVCLSGFVSSALGQSAGVAPARILCDETAHTFRIDGAGVSYVFGVNQNGEVQALYWGQRLQPADPIPPARADGGASAFDLPVNATPQEFTGWGGGLVVAPNLKITFPDGNRDLVLHYVSHAIQHNTLTVSLKDISRDVFVDLIYRMDEETGVLARSARIENRPSCRSPSNRFLQRRGTWAQAITTSCATSPVDGRENGICSRSRCIPERSSSRVAVALPVTR